MKNKVWKSLHFIRESMIILLISYWNSRVVLDQHIIQSIFITPLKISFWHFFWVDEVVFQKTFFTFCPGHTFCMWHGKMLQHTQNLICAPKNKPHKNCDSIMLQYLSGSILCLVESLNLGVKLNWLLNFIKSKTWTSLTKAFLFRI